MAPFSERRQTIRIAVNGNLNVESVTGGQPMRLIDVGMGGFGVHTVAGMTPDVVTSYRFVTPDGKWSAVFRARALYSKVLPADGTSVVRYFSGFMFVNVESPATQRQLMALIDHATAFMSFS